MLTLPEGSGDPGPAGVWVVLNDVHRWVVSHRLGRWDDDEATVVPCTEAEFSAVVREFGRAPVYGWEFFDTPEESWQRWAGRLSLDALWIPGPARHTIELFQEGHVEGGDRHLDFRAWFDALQVDTEDGREIPLDDFAAGGTRWWDALYAGDTRTAGAGIYPLKREPSDPQ